MSNSLASHASACNDSLLSQNLAIKGAFKHIENSSGFGNRGLSSYSDSTGEPGYSDYSDYTDCPADH